MYQSNLTQRSLRSALLLGAASIVAVGVAAPASADTVETVVVTGSLIPTPNATSNSPIQSVSAEAIDLSGHPNVEQLINTLPQIVPGLGASSNNPGGGEAVVDLRGLSPNRNLVLIDGRRAMTTSLTGEVDINTIPAAMIDHIDIVSGGGSATYGSDAISGVINFVLKKDFEGFQGQVRYGQEFKHGFAPEKSLNLTVGVNTADGKGNVTMFAEYFKRNEVLQGQDPRFAIDNFGGSSTSPAGRVEGGQGFPQVTTNGCPLAVTKSTYAFKANGDPEGFCNLLPTTADAKANAFASNFETLDGQGDRFNFSPFNDLVTPDRRVSVAANGHYDILPGIELYGSTHFVENVVGNILAPTPVTPQPGFPFSVFPKAACAGIGTRPGNGVVGCDPSLNRTAFFTNPTAPGGIGTTAFITPAFQAAIDARAGKKGYTPFSVRWRSLQLGARKATFTTDELQLTAGLRGQFGSFFGGWDWDAYYDYGRATFDAINLHNVITSHLSAGMMGCPPGSPNTIEQPCADVNIFGFGNLSPAAVHYLDYTTNDYTTYDREVVHGETHGELFDLPGGPLSLALGAEYRKDTAAFTPDQAKQNFDIQGFNGALATKGGFNVTEFFMETRVPILSDLPGAQYLGLEGGYRYSDYSNSGSLSTWKAGGEYQPIDDVRFRVMWQRAARSPNVFELFNGGTQGFPGFTDACAGVDVTVAAPVATLQGACHAQFEAAGAHDAENVSWAQSNAQFQAVGFGNNSLTPEKSNTFTAGAVLTPTFLPGVTASVDYYHIAINNFIGGAYGGSAGAMNTCIAAIQAGNPIPAYIAVGDPANPAHTTATAANACQYVTRLPNGDLIFDIPNENSPSALGNLKTGGLDIQVGVQHDLADLFGSSDDMGSVDLNVALSLLTQFEDPNGPSSCGGSNLKGVLDYCGTAVFASVDIRPAIRWNARMGYTLDDFRFLLTWNHIGKVNDNFGFGGVLPAYDTFDFAVRWNFSENYSIDFIVDNLFDKQPPLGPYSGLGGINTIAEAYDVLGTRGSIGFTARL